MITRFFLISLVFVSLACSKKENLEYEKSQRIDPYVVYQEGLTAFEKKDYFFASKKFDEAEFFKNQRVNFCCNFAPVRRVGIVSTKPLET